MRNKGIKIFEILETSRKKYHPRVNNEHNNDVDSKDDYNVWKYHVRDAKWYTNDNLDSSTKEDHRHVDEDNYNKGKRWRRLFMNNNNFIDDNEEEHGRPNYVHYHRPWNHLSHDIKTTTESSYTPIVASDVVTQGTFEQIRTPDFLCHFGDILLSQKIRLGCNSGIYHIEISASGMTDCNRRPQLMIEGWNYGRRTSAQSFPERINLTWWGTAEYSHTNELSVKQKVQMVLRSRLTSSQIISWERQQRDKLLSTRLRY